MDTPSTEPISIPPIAIPPIAGTDVGFDGIGMPEHITDTFLTSRRAIAGSKRFFFEEKSA